ncbi:MAG TPA: DUF2232 domain-containing protein [Stellaceae bacterium]|nr:DUF2232 domain-containing protein [Stellaceae bacterium]
MGRLGAAAVAALCGVVAGSFYLTVLLGSPGALILVYLTQLPLFAAGLWLGLGAAAIAGATATLILLATSDLLAAAIFAALNAVPVVLLVRQALLARPGADNRVIWYPPGLLAAWLTGVALAGIAAALIAFGGPTAFHATLRAAVAHELARLPLQGTEADRTALAGAFALVIPGMVAASWMVMTVINGALAQGLLARFKLNWRSSPELTALDLPRWVAGALAVAAGLTLFGGVLRFIGINVLITLVVPFGLAGLAVLHTATQRLQHPRVALVVFYTLAGLFGWPLLVAAAFGLCEPWLGLRRRLAPGKGMPNG